jgi:hypothetical protein
MFKYKSYTDREIARYELPSGYIECIGKPADLVGYACHLFEALGHFRDEELVLLVWVNNHTMDNQAIWDHYSKNIRRENPHIPPSDRTMFDYLNHELVEEYGDFENLDLFNYCKSYLSEADANIILSLATDKKLIIGDTEIETVYPIQKKSSRS